MAILKANGKILKANGKVLVKDNRLLFLTYFDNYDEQTRIDVPLIGDPYKIDPISSSYTYGQKITKTTFNVPWGIENGIHDEYYNNNRYVGYKKSIEDLKFVSGEFFIYCGGTMNAYPSAICAATTFSGLDPNYSYEKFDIQGPNLSGKDYTLYNGTSIYSSQYGNYAVFGVQMRFNTTHYAQTYDVENKIERFYVNGLLMLEIRGGTFDEFIFGFSQNNTGKYFNITGVAWWNYDRSTNDKMNYPVPTKRLR